MAKGEAPGRWTGSGLTGIEGVEAGDPDLHTLVAVANNAQTQESKWLSIYGRVLHQHVVAASETYNTSLEHRLALSV